MANLGKYFAPAAVVLAIAVATCSFLLFQQRLKFRNRAATMAEALVSITQTMDEDADSGTSDDISFTRAERSSDGKEGGSLGWEKNKKVNYNQTNNPFKQKVDLIVELADSIRDQRASMREKVIEIATKMNCPADMVPVDEDMARLETYPSSLDKFAEFTGNTANRRDAYVEQLNNLIAKSKGQNMPKFSADTPNGAFTDADKRAFAEFATRLDGMNNSYETMVKLLLQGKDKVTAFDWSHLSDSDFKNIDFTREEGRIKRIMQQFVLNMENINGELQKFDTLKREYAALADAKANLEDRTAKLEADNARMQELINQLVYKVFPGGEPPRPVEKAKSYEDLDKNVIGSVLNYDEEFKLVFLNLNHAQVMPGLKMAVLIKDQYVGTICVTEADAYTSTATWISGNINDLKKGVGYVIFAEDAIQDKLVPQN